MKKTYISPAFIAVELGMKNVAMLSASDENGNILGYEGEGNGTDIGVKGVSDVKLWDNEW